MTDNIISFPASSREAKIHVLKCWPEPFEAVLSGRKTAEFRLNDRDFRVGDSILLNEWHPTTGVYTGRGCLRVITHVLDSGYGMPDGFAMLSLEPTDLKARIVILEEELEELRAGK